MSADGSYAPKSPDLSSFYSGGPTQPPPQSPQPPQYQRPGSQQSQTHFSPVAPGLHLQPQAGGPYCPPTSSTSPQVHTQHLSLDPHPLSAGYSPTSQQYYSSFPQQPPPPLGYGLQSPTAQQVPPPFYQQPYQNLHPQQAFNPPPQAEIGYRAYAPAPFIKEDPDQKPASIMPPRKAASAAASRPEIEPSPVKTKFPTARIKRIMQADEEVGKVAQQTPIAVGKALEMFMVALVTKSADVAREKNSKRVSAQMLKQVVESDDQWDFLRDIVGRVENEDGGGKGKAARAPKAESESEEEVAEKKKVRGGRKKKAAAAAA